MYKLCKNLGYRICICTQHVQRHIYIHIHILDTYDSYRSSNISYLHIHMPTKLRICIYHHHPSMASFFRWWILPPSLRDISVQAGMANNNSSA